MKLCSHRAGCSESPPLTVFLPPTDSGCYHTCLTKTIPAERKILFIEPEPAEATRLHSEKQWFFHSNWQKLDETDQNLPGSSFTVPTIITSSDWLRWGLKSANQERSETGWTSNQKRDFGRKAQWLTESLLYIVDASSCNLNVYAHEMIRSLTDEYFWCSVAREATFIQSFRDSDTCRKSCGRVLTS